MRWSRESLQSMRYEQDKLPPQVIESGWLGYPGATEAQIAQAEARLGMVLPRSYREFLKVTNGWYLTTPFVCKLWSTDEIERFAVRRQDWINDFTERYKREHYMNVTFNGSDIHLRTPSIPDEEYLVYGYDQDPKKLRIEYLQTALEISDRENSAIYLLNPQIDLNHDGEWEAWYLEDSLPDNGDLGDDWRPGATRYRSFLEMMQEEYRSFDEMQES
ncbi:SMI1/KNR4 family protein [Leptodesmis sichuanensis]|uniref:SMI1/KNR4 family protein n=1 Tax=Leptodesmis sichuanensis TaxID=2906798 RepID=UPI001F1BD8EF|nr:SMI1/KNR4 family protein [Leptodesmis sichuanensis]UIE39673.1 SMI1/KNR4 family protein [Leptodesmis sichuanensis A121]